MLTIVVVRYHGVLLTMKLLKIILFILPLSLSLTCIASEKETSHLTQELVNCLLSNSSEEDKAKLGIFVLAHALKDTSGNNQARDFSINLDDSVITHVNHELKSVVSNIVAKHCKKEMQRLTNIQNNR